MHEISLYLFSSGAFLAAPILQLMTMNSSVSEICCTARFSVDSSAYIAPAVLVLLQARALGKKQPGDFRATSRWLPSWQQLRLEHASWHAQHGTTSHMERCAITGKCGRLLTCNRYVVGHDLEVVPDAGDGAYGEEVGGVALEREEHHGDIDDNSVQVRAREGGLKAAHHSIDAHTQRDQPARKP